MIYTSFIKIKKNEKKIFRKKKRSDKRIVNYQTKFKKK